jgi:hypothetical protein
MNLPGMIALETFKPTMYVGGFMGRFFFSPFTIILGTNFEKGTEKLFMALQNRENVDKLIKRLEQLEIEEKEVEKRAKEERNRLEQEKPQKKGWRRFIPF